MFRFLEFRNRFIEQDFIRRLINVIVDRFSDFQIPVIYEIFRKEKNIMHVLK